MNYLSEIMGSQNTSKNYLYKSKNKNMKKLKSTYFRAEKQIKDNDLIVKAKLLHDYGEIVDAEVYVNISRIDIDNHLNKITLYNDFCPYKYGYYTKSVKLSPGVYNVTFYFKGDGIYKRSQTKISHFVESDTRIIVDNCSFIFGKFKFKCKVLNYKGNIIKDGEVSLSINGVKDTFKCKYKKGFYEVPLDLPIGTYNCIVKFNGDYVNKPSFNSFSIDVTLKPTRFEVIYENRHDKLIYKIKLFFENKELSNKKIYFSVTEHDDKLYSGICKYKKGFYITPVMDLQGKDCIVNFNFKGYKLYAPCNKRIHINNFEFIPTYFTDIIEERNQESLIFKTKLFSKDGELPNEKINFNISELNSNIHSGICKYENGFYTAFVSGLPGGNYDITFYFNGNKKYKSFNKIHNFSFRPNQLKNNSMIKSTYFIVIEDENLKVKLISDGKEIPNEEVIVKIFKDSLKVFEGFCNYVNNFYVMPELDLSGGKYEVDFCFNGNSEYEMSSKRLKWIKKTKTDIVIDKKSFLVGDSKFKCRLIDKDRFVEIIDKTVFLYINNIDKVFECQYDKGFYTVDLNLPAGVYDVTAKFKGDHLYSPFIINFSIEIKLKSTYLELVEDHYDDKLGYKAKLFSDNEEIEDGDVGVRILKLGEEVFDGLCDYLDGFYTIPPIDLPGGKYDLKFYFKGNDIYEGASKDADLIVKSNISFIADYIQHVYVGNSLFKCKLFDESNDEIVDVDISICIEGIDKIFKCRYDNGYYTSNLNLPIGKYKFKTIFGGNDFYYPFSLESCIEVSLKPTCFNVKIENTPKKLISKTKLLAGNKELINEKVYFEIFSLSNKVSSGVCQYKDGFYLVPPEDLPEKDYKIIFIFKGSNLYESSKKRFIASYKFHL